MLLAWRVVVRVFCRREREVVAAARFPFRARSIDSKLETQLNSTACSPPQHTTSLTRRCQTQSGVVQLAKKQQSKLPLTTQHLLPIELLPPSPFRPFRPPPTRHRLSSPHLQLRRGHLERSTGASVAPPRAAFICTCSSEQSYVSFEDEVSRLFRPTRTTWFHCRTWWTAALLTTRKSSV